MVFAEREREDVRIAFDQALSDVGLQLISKRVFVCTQSIANSDLPSFSTVFATTWTIFPHPTSNMHNSQFTVALNAIS